MNRILILGCCGAGKSTLAVELSKYLKLSIIHLDQHYFGPDWKEPETSEWREKVALLSQGNKWIMDGNYGGTLDIRLQRADTIIYLDQKTWKSLYRVVRRTIKYHGKVRPDLAPGCKERWDINFLFYVLHFNQIKKPSILSRLVALAPEKSIHILKSASDIESFIQTLPKA